jgi:hypothetical protein
VSENRMLGNEMDGDWRRLHNEELHNLYTSQNVIWVIIMMRYAGHAPRMGEKRNSYNILVGETE